MKEWRKPLTPPSWRRRITSSEVTRARGWSDDWAWVPRPRAHLPQWCRLPDKKHVDDPEVFDDARPREKRQRRHFHHCDRAAPKRAAGAERARPPLGQRAGALQGRDWRFREYERSSSRRKGKKHRKAKRRSGDTKKHQTKTINDRQRCKCGHIYEQWKAKHDVR